MESELFGYEQGAFTGATSAKPGRFELADQGTLFLDEIGEIPVEMQVKLLRAIQESEFERVGGIKTLQVNVRLITATNRNLKEEVASGAFREDLYYRLNVVPLNIPPLRDRRDDIPLLVDHIIDKFRTRLNKDIQGISDEALRLLCNHSWPGNIRELENVLERTILFVESLQIEASDLPDEFIVGPDAGGANSTESAVPILGSGNSSTGNSSTGNSSTGNTDTEKIRTLPPGNTSLKDAVRAETSRVEKDMIAHALGETKGNVTKAAKLLKISRKSLQMKMKEFGLRDRESGN